MSTDARISKEIVEAVNKKYPIVDFRHHLKHLEVIVQETGLGQILKHFKGTVSVILSDPPFIDCHVVFTMVSL